MKTSFNVKFNMWISKVTIEFTVFEPELKFTWSYLLLCYRVVTWSEVLCLPLFTSYDMGVKLYIRPVRYCIIVSLSRGHHCTQPCSSRRGHQNWKTISLVSVYPEMYLTVMKYTVRGHLILSIESIHSKLPFHITLCRVFIVDGS